ncbi:MAG: ABC transporter ATP-binding protein [Aerococcus sp.]|nr:ABC transporter ATP-binding protein [Aerococcus sp.]
MSKITVTDVNKTFPNFRLKDVSLEVNAGEIVALVGHNGAGKTTLLKLLSGELEADSGSLRAIDTEKLGYLFDDNLLIDSLTVNQYKTIFSGIYPHWHEKIFDALMAKYQLPVDTPIHNFSKGMLVQLNVSVVLSHDPHYLLLDEITSGLDPFTREEILKEIKQYVNQNDAVAIFSTHILEDVPLIANRLLIMEHGRVAANVKVSPNSQMEAIRKVIKGSSEVSEWIDS